MIEFTNLLYLYIFTGYGQGPNLGAGYGKGGVFE